MNQQTSKKEIQNQVKNIGAIYQDYIVRLNELKDKQSEIINKFIKELEQRKMGEIRKTLK